MKKETKEEILVRAYEEHEQSLLRCSYYKVHNHELADDLVQNTFLKTWEYLQSHKEIDSVRGFLFHVLNQLIIDEYRKKKQISLDGLVDAGYQIEIDESSSLPDEVDGKAVILLIPLLDDKYQKVISMRFEEEKTITEIAKATKQKNNTVIVQIHRGIDKLAILFKTGKKE